MARTRLSKLRAFAARYRRDRRGATAVEFGVVALPFFMLLMGIMEIGLVSVASVALDNATYAVSRQIRTGEMTAANGSSAGFKSAICSSMGFLQTDCMANLTVDVRTATGFSSISTASPLTCDAAGRNCTFNPGSVTFNPGAPNDIVVARVWYNWRVISPLLNEGLARLAGGRALLTSAITFRNEPPAI